jgi:hypothetical protein
VTWSVAAADKAAPEEALEPWASNRHPKDVAAKHMEEITAAKQQYWVKHGETMDGANCRSPIGGSFGAWEQELERGSGGRESN